MMMEQLSGKIFLQIIPIILVEVKKDHMNKNIDNDFGKPVKFKGDSFGVKVSFEGDKDFYKKADIKEIDHMGELTVNADENIN